MATNSPCVANATYDRPDAKTRALQARNPFHPPGFFVGDAGYAAARFAVKNTVSRALLELCRVTLR